MAVVWEPCGTCNGNGGWMVPNPNGKGGMILMECKSCQGKGGRNKNV